MVRKTTSEMRLKPKTDLGSNFNRDKIIKYITKLIKIQKSKNHKLLIKS